MATLASLIASPASVAPAGAATFTAVFDVAAGQADQTLTGELRDAAGVVIATATVVLDNPDPEADPAGLTFRVRDAAGASVGTVTGFTGVREDADTYTARWTWTAP